MTSTGDFSPSFWTRRWSDRALSRPCYGAHLQDALKMSSLQQSEHTVVIPRVVKEPPCPTEGNVCLFFSLSIHWISFHGFMSYILLLYDTTLAWSALFSYRRVVELSVTTEDVLICCDGKMDSTGHIPLSTFQRNVFFFNLTQEVFWREFWRPGIQTPKARLLYVTPTRPLFHGNQGLRMERL